MNIQTLAFSPTQTTQTVVTKIAQSLKEYLYDSNIDSQLGFHIDITAPTSRQETYHFTDQDIVIIGMPVYAGRIPNLIVPFLNTLKANNSIAIPVVLFGNRAYDDALYELCDICEDCGFLNIAAGAFIGQHSFSDKIATGRPNASDLGIADHFAQEIAQVISQHRDINAILSKEWFHQEGPIKVPGRNKEERAYFQPKKKSGAKIDIRKIKPVTNDDCNDCKLCAQRCPMGAIDFNNVHLVPGICIKCGACVMYCPQKAKSFTDPDYLYHVDDIANRLAVIPAIIETFVLPNT